MREYKNHRVFLRAKYKSRKFVIINYEEREIQENLREDKREGFREVGKEEGEEK